jgi:hypothetical protein
MSDRQPNCWLADDGEHFWFDQHRIEELENEMGIHTAPSPLSLAACQREGEGK